MKVFYDISPDAQGRHKIFYAVPDNELFYFKHTTNIPLSEKVVDELAPDNQAICIELRRTLNKVDSEGDNKYYIDVDGDIIEKEGWIQDYGEIFQG